MASVKSVNMTNITATPVVNASSEQAGGKLRVWYDTYEASSLGSGSDITIARLPANATVHDVIVKADALAGSSTLIAGIASDTDLFWGTNSITWNAAGQSCSMVNGISTGAPSATVTGLGYRTTAETDVILTTGGATISNTIYSWVIYSTE